MGMLREALKEFSEAVGINPGLQDAVDDKIETEAEIDLVDPTSRDPDTVKVQYLEEAKAMSNRGDYTTAIGKLDLALQIDPDYIEALSERADLKIKANLLAEALDDFNRVVRIDPKQGEVWMRLANISLLGMKAESMAETYYLEGLKHNPTHI